MVDLLMIVQDTVRTIRVGDEPDALIRWTTAITPIVLAIVALYGEFMRRDHKKAKVQNEQIVRQNTNIQKQNGDIKELVNGQSDKMRAEIKMLRAQLTENKIVPKEMK